MSSKLITSHKNNACNVGQISLISKFYMKLPEEVIDFAINRLSRDVKRKVKKEKRTEGKIIMALNMSASMFADAVYDCQRSGMIFSEDAEYEEILASYNSENCIINTVLILKKCCDGTFGQKIIGEFIKSSEFKKTISEDYDNYKENEEENEKEAEEEINEEIEEVEEENEQEVEEEEEEHEEENSEDNTVTEIESETVFESEPETEPENVQETPETPVPPEIPASPESAEPVESIAPPEMPAPAEPVAPPEPTVLTAPPAPPIISVPSVKAEEKKKKAKEKVTVYYIGNIETRGTFYNFRPQYTLEVSTSGKKLIEMYQIPEKFPKFGSINLSYVGNRRSQEVLDNLDLNLIYAINCADILEKNINLKNGELNEVNIKIDLQKEFDSKRNSSTFFKKISDLRIFRVVRPDEYIPDKVLFRDEIEISDDFSKGELVLLQRRKDNFSISDEDDISGPYKVDKRDGRTFIQPKVAEERYLLNCYEEDKLSFGTIEIQEFDSDPTGTDFAVITDSSNYKKDIISNDILIKSMLSDTSNNFFNVVRGEFDEFLRMCKVSPFLSGNLPDDMRTKRLGKIKKLFSIVNNYTEEQKNIVKLLLQNYSNDDDIKELLSETIKSSDEFKRIQREVEEKAGNIQNEMLLEQLKKKNIETSAIHSEIHEKNEEIENLEKKISNLKEEYNSILSYDNVAQEIRNQQNIMKFLSKENSKLEQVNEELKGKIKNTIQEQANDVGIAFDPYISNAMLEAAGEWNRKQECENYVRVAEYTARKALNCNHKNRKELCQYLVNYVKQYRNYNTNDILNMYVCITQGFLTVFSGLPGTGKTSICNIIGGSLGLTDFGKENILPDINCSRFVPVSVEKGWSSKRDLIGYYNPLTQKYDKSNRRLYDSLMILNEEKNNSAFPYIVLLDEANLSPMEYYWADFMQIADKSDNSESYINIGLENDIYIPDTLRFIATINNDQTTETLSPRLLDRAWIIKLPDAEIKEEITPPSEFILWKDLVSVFDADANGHIRFELLLKQIFSLFRNYGMAVSPRIQLSIRRYICSAQDVMESVGGVDSDYVALDYAVMQKLLPKINGHIKIYKNFFDELLDICTNNNLKMTKNAVEKMQKNSSRNMGYCQYLS